MNFFLFLVRLSLVVMLDVYSGGKREGESGDPERQETSDHGDPVNGIIIVGSCKSRSSHGFRAPRPRSASRPRDREVEAGVYVLRNFSRVLNKTREWSGSYRKRGKSHVKGEKLYYSRNDNPITGSSKASPS